MTIVVHLLSPEKTDPFIIFAVYGTSALCTAIEAVGIAIIVTAVAAIAIAMSKVCWDNRVTAPMLRIRANLQTMHLR